MISGNTAPHAGHVSSDSRMGAVTMWRLRLALTGAEPQPTKRESADRSQLRSKLGRQCTASEFEVAQARQRDGRADEGRIGEMPYRVLLGVGIVRGNAVDGNDDLESARDCTGDGVEHGAVRGCADNDHIVDTFALEEFLEL